METLRDCLLMGSSTLRYIISKRRVKGRRVWVHRINQRRSAFGEFSHSFLELTEHRDKFHDYFRILSGSFE
jgi:hypothetical protein